MNHLLNYFLPSNIICLSVISCFHVDSHQEELDCTFDALSLKNSDAYTERHLEMIGDCMNDFLDEQKRLHVYSRAIAKPRQEQIRWMNKRRVENEERREEGEPELPISLASSDLKPLPEGKFSSSLSILTSVPLL